DFFFLVPSEGQLSEGVIFWHVTLELDTFMPLVTYYILRIYYTTTLDSVFALTMIFLFSTSVRHQLKLAIILGIGSCFFFGWADCLYDLWAVYVFQNV
ncbi:hypothetical protein ACJX0J_030407, partial [Zea mays]